ncbi:MAG TPA: thiamine pyrophosphate-dependent enzyme [Candidatus Binatia bacterium]|jgi:sulfopyruvate decarboxylase subunit beta
MKRFDCLKVLASLMKEDDLAVTNVGYVQHEWRVARPSRANLYGLNMGQCTSTALGLSLALPHRNVFALEGDGSLLLSLASLADLAYQKPANLRLIVFDNEAYETPGGMPTATARGVDLVQVAKGCGIAGTFLARTIEEFEAILRRQQKELLVIVAKIEMGTIEVAQYSNVDFKFNKYMFASYIEESEKIPVLRLRSRSPFTQ